MGRGTPTSPLTLYATDDRQGHVISVVAAFVQSTGVLRSITFTRDPLCLLTMLHIGIGSDGKPESSVMTFPVPAGTHVVSAAMLSSVGLNTITDVLKFQITASR
ncbi:MAG: hypothetical protein ACREQ5_00025 [Candidatus Dormibacteria bacterium]